MMAAETPSPLALALAEHPHTRRVPPSCLQPRPIKHAPIGFGVAPGGPAVAGRPPPGLAGVPGGGVDPAGRSVGLPSVTPVPYTALTGGP